MRSSKRRFYFRENPELSTRYIMIYIYGKTVTYQLLQVYNSSFLNFRKIFFKFKPGELFCMQTIMNHDARNATSDRPKLKMGWKSGWQGVGISEKTDLSMMRGVGERVGWCQQFICIIHTIKIIKYMLYQ